MRLTGIIQKTKYLTGELHRAKVRDGGNRIYELVPEEVDASALGVVSGTLPLTFTPAANRVEDYVICGRTGGVGNPRNKLGITLTSRTTNGVTATVGNDGSVTLNGTASNTAFFTVRDEISVAAGDILMGCPAGGGSTTYLMRFSLPGGQSPFFTDTGSGVVCTQSLTGQILIRINSGYTCNNVVFRPVLYSEVEIPITVNGTTVTIVSNKLLYPGDRLFMRDTGVVIPAVIGESNTITAGTTVAPEMTVIYKEV